MPRILTVPPPHDADDLTQLLYAQEGVLSRRQALRLMSEKVLRHRLETGRWQVAHPGTYVAHNGPISRDQQRWIAVLAGGTGQPATLGGLSALEDAGLRGYASPNFHVVIPAGRRDHDPPSGVIVHRSTTLSPADVHRLSTPARTTVARSVVDAARWASNDDRARAIIAATFQQRLVNLRDIEACLGRLRRVRRRALILATATDAHDGSHSIGELDLVKLCRRHRLPTPDRQVRRTDAQGRRRYLDALFEQWKIQVEVDGGQHMEILHWWDDTRRQNALWVAGLRILRFPGWVVRDRPGEVVAVLRAALVDAGWRPPERAGNRAAALSRHPRRPLRGLLRPP